MQWLCVFVIHLSSASVKKGQQGTVEGDAKRTPGRLCRRLYVIEGLFYCVFLCSLINNNIFLSLFSPRDIVVSFILSHMEARSLGDIWSAINNVGRESKATNGNCRFFSCMAAFLFSRPLIFQTQQLQSTCSAVRVPKLRFGQERQFAETGTSHRNGLKTVSFPHHHTLIFINILQIISCN